MTATIRTAALIVAAGAGSRAGAGLPKQYRQVAGAALVTHACRAFLQHPAIDDVLVVIGADQDKLLDEALGATVGAVRRVAGGATRRASVRAGLDALGDATRVLVHDAARPLVPAEVIDRVLEGLGRHDGAVPVLAVADTLAQGDGDQLGDTVSRAGLYRIQTPQGFNRAVLQRAHLAWPVNEEATDDAQMLRRLGDGVALVQGDAMLDKITTPEDFALAEAHAAGAWEVRTATGFDVHRLEAGEELWLGGVLIPHDRGLSGHSDADVALHAITDALLGTIAAGDIGTHFPPSDPQWRGAASDRFLRHAADLIEGRGGTIDFVDLTLLCEAPKIGPHRAAMTARIAEILRLTPDRVSIKATTTERLGFTGRGEGIAAQAAATVRLPRAPR